MEETTEKTIQVTLEQALRERDLYKAALAQANLNYQEKVEELSLLRRLTEVLRYIPDNKRVCQSLLDALADQLGASNSCLAVYQEESREPILIVSTGSALCKEVLDEAVQRWHRHSRARRATGESHAHEARSETAGRASWVRFLYERDGDNSNPGLYIPIEVHGSLLGIFYFDTPGFGRLHSEEERILPIVSDLVASILLNVRLYHELAQYSRIMEKRTKLLEEMNERLTRTQAQLVQSEKLAGIGLFAGGIAHEMNNPLMGITGHLDLLIEENQDNPELLERLEVIRKQAERCSRIVHGVLDFARFAPDEWAEVDINSSLEELLTLIEPQLRRQNIEVVRDFSRNLPSVMGNRNRLQQVFLNIISNAQKAMPNGGVFRLETRVESGRQRRVVISFADSGCGIPEENIAKVFDPFFTTAEVGKGTGLGLAISFGIVKDHGGEIVVDSKRDCGTTFKVILPVGQRRKEATRSASKCNKPGNE
jgi:signal transduction histidine kinase